MKYILILTLLCVSISYSQNVLSLQEIVDASLENNYTIRTNRLSSDISSNNVNIGNAGMLPKIDLNAGYNYSYDYTQIETPTPGFGVDTAGQTRTLTGGVQLNWTLFDGKAMFINYDRLKTLNEQSQIQLQVAIENNIREIVSAYYAAVELKKAMEALSETVELNKERLERLETQQEFGSALTLQVLQAQVNLNRDSTTYLTTELNYRNLIRRLNFLMGNKTFDFFDVNSNVDFEQLPNKEELLDITLRMNNSINSAVMQGELSEFEKDLILASMEPRLDLRAGYNYNRVEAEAGFFLFNETRSSSVGINFSFNLFDGFKKQNALQNAKIQMEIADVSLEQVKSTILLNFENAYDNYIRRQAILEQERQNIQTAELNLTRTEELFNLGQATGVELREAQLNLLRSQNSISGAEAQLKIAESELLLISGQFLK